MECIEQLINEPCVLALHNASFKDLMHCDITESAYTDYSLNITIFRIRVFRILISYNLECLELVAYFSDDNGWLQLVKRF